MRHWYSRIGAALIGGTLAAGVGAAPALEEQAAAQFSQENYEEVRALLDRPGARPLSPRASRLLGLTQFHLLDYAAARPLLGQALQRAPDDRSVRLALVEVLLAYDEADEALELLQPALAADAARAWLLAGRVHAELEQPEQAREAFARAVRLDRGQWLAAQRGLALLAAASGETTRVAEIAAAVEARAPNSFEAFELRELAQQRGQPVPPLRWSAGYRLESDSNVALDPDDPAVVLDVADEADIRHVLSADLNGHLSLSGRWSLFAEAHLYHGAHQDLNDYDQTRQNYVLSLGWSGARYGVRLPLELTWNHLDGENYRTAQALTPGAYVTFDNGVLLYGYGRYLINDYDEAVDAAEVRSGELGAAGAVLVWPLAGDRLQLRLSAEAGHDATDGANWERDELALGIHMDFEPAPSWRLGLGYTARKHDYDNLHDVYLVRREDEAGTWFAEARYAITPSWELLLQGTQVDWGSNIDIYDYERRVLALGVRWSQ